MHTIKLLYVAIFKELLNILFENIPGFAIKIMLNKFLLKYMCSLTPGNTPSKIYYIRLCRLLLSYVFLCKFLTFSFIFMYTYIFLLDFYCIFTYCFCSIFISIICSSHMNVFLKTLCYFFSFRKKSIFVNDVAFYANK